MKAEIAANWSRAEDSIAAARSLAESGFYDFAASRAYYAGFYAASAALLAEGISFGTHSGVINGIHQHFVKPGRLSRELGRSLNWLAELRAVGDYGEIRHVPERQAEQAIDAAERFVAALRRLFVEPMKAPQLTIIRREKPGDEPAVRALLEEAFGQPDEAALVEALRARGAATLSMVALRDQRLVGHILFSPVTIAADDSSFDALGLGPMAVAPDCQRQGVGSQLAAAGLEECRRAGHEVVVVLGHPKYYPRFGFVPAGPLGIGCDFEVPEEAFMVLELRPGALDGRQGTVRYQPELGAF